MMLVRAVRCQSRSSEVGIGADRLRLMHTPGLTLHTRLQFGMNVTDFARGIAIVICAITISNIHVQDGSWPHHHVPGRV